MSHLFSGDLFFPGVVYFQWLSLQRAKTVSEQGWDARRGGSVWAVLLVRGSLSAPLGPKGLASQNFKLFLGPVPCLTVFPPVILPAASDSHYTLLHLLFMPILVWTLEQWSGTTSQPWFPQWLLALHQTYSVKTPKGCEDVLADEVNDELEGSVLERNKLQSKQQRAQSAPGLSSVFQLRNLQCDGGAVWQKAIKNS